MTTKNDFIVNTTLHSHAPDARREPIRNILADLREEAKNSTSDTRTIVANASAKATYKAIQMKMPKVSAMSRNIRHIKRKRNLPPMTPQTVRELIISGSYTVTSKGKPFMMYDSGDSSTNDQRRTVIFATEENLSFLSQCKEWYMDGTFNICPPLFHQVYTIHGN